MSDADTLHDRDRNSMGSTGVCGDCTAAGVSSRWSLLLDFALPSKYPSILTSPPTVCWLLQTAVFFAASGR
jgi:hypothetical protein